MEGSSFYVEVHANKYGTALRRASKDVILQIITLKNPRVPLISTGHIKDFLSQYFQGLSLLYGIYEELAWLTQPFFFSDCVLGAASYSPIYDECEEFHCCGSASRYNKNE
jgi:hypothetical protein